MVGYSLSHSFITLHKLSSKPSAGPKSAAPEEGWLFERDQLCHYKEQKETFCIKS